MCSVVWCWMFEEIRFHIWSKAPTYPSSRSPTCHRLIHHKHRFQRCHHRCFVLSVKKCFDIETFAGTNSINLRWLQRRRRRWGKVKDRKMSGSSHGAMRRHFGEMSVGNAIQHWNTVVKYSLEIQLNNTQQRGEMCVGNAIQPRFNPEIWPCCKRGRLQMRERLVSCFSNKAKVCSLCPLEE